MVMLLYVLEEGIGLCYIEAESSEMKCQSQSGGKFYAEKDATQMVFVKAKDISAFVTVLYMPSCAIKYIPYLYQIYISHHMPSNHYISVWCAFRHKILGPYLPPNALFSLYTLSNIP